MSDELPDSASDHAPVDVTLNASSNGVHREDVGAVATAVAPDSESDGADAPASIDSEPEASTATASSTGTEGDGDGSTTDEAVQAGEPATGQAEPDDDTGFLAELVRAMQTTAAAERARLGEDADRRRDAHVASVEARRAAEVEGMRQLAADDLKNIDTWAEEERQRIQAEHDRRAAALQADLESSLAEHGGRIDREIAAVQEAVATYRADMDAFFAALDRESDPVAIARQASRRPAFPALETIGAEAVKGAGDRTDSTPAAEGAGVGVMAESSAPAASGPDSADEPTADVASGESDSGEGAPTPVATDEAAVTAETWVSSGGSAPVLQSVPISRPMSWLRRDRDQDHTDR